MAPERELLLTTHTHTRPELPPLEGVRLQCFGVRRARLGMFIPRFCVRPLRPIRSGAFHQVQIGGRGGTVHRWQISTAEPNKIDIGDNIDEQLSTVDPADGRRWGYM